MSDTLRSSATQVRLPARRRPLVALAGIALLLAVQQLASLGGSGLFGEALTNAAHIPLFALLTLLVASVLGRRPWWRLLVVVIAIAVGTEVLQALTPRNASLSDLALDLLGALPVIGALELRVALRRRGHRRPGVVPWTVAVSLLVVMFVAAPVRMLIAYAERDRAFPELLTPNRVEGPLVDSNSAVRVVDAPPGWTGHAGEPVIELVWAVDPYPGIVLREVVPVWNAFQTLEVDVYLPEGPPMPLTAAVAHAGTEGTARFVRRIALPGPQRLSYPLEALLTPVEDAPVRVERLILHTNRAQRGRTLLLGSVRLTARHEPANAGNLVTSD